MGHAAESVVRHVCAASIEGPRRWRTLQEEVAKQADGVGEEKHAIVVDICRVPAARSGTLQEEVVENGHRIRDVDLAIRCHIAAPEDAVER